MNTEFLEHENVISYFDEYLKTLDVITKKIALQPSYGSEEMHCVEFLIGLTRDFEDTHAHSSRKN